MDKFTKAYVAGRHDALKSLQLTRKEATIGDVWHDLSPLTRRALTGAGIGATAGAVADENTERGAIVGGLAGAGAGMLYNKARPIVPAAMPGTYVATMSPRIRSRYHDYTTLVPETALGTRSYAPANAYTSGAEYGGLPVKALPQLAHQKGLHYDNAGRINWLSADPKYKEDIRHLSLKIKPTNHIDKLELNSQYHPKDVNSTNHPLPPGISDFKPETWDALTKIVDHSYNPEIAEMPRKYLDNVGEDWKRIPDTFALPQEPTELVYNGPLRHDRKQPASINEMRRLLRLQKK